MALDEREEVREHLEDVDESEGLDMDERRTQVSRPQ
jgi:Ras GTPase-activating-like protein IQGAP2/3